MRDDSDPLLWTAERVAAFVASGPRLVDTLHGLLWVGRTARGYGFGRGEYTHPVSLHEGVFAPAELVIDLPAADIGRRLELLGAEPVPPAAPMGEPMTLGQWNRTYSRRAEHAGA